MTATCLNTNGIEAVLRICCCAADSIVFHGRKTTALSLTLSTLLKLTGVRQIGQGTRRSIVSAPIEEATEMSARRLATLSTVPTIILRRPGQI